MAVSQKTNVAQEVASVMQKIAHVTEETDDRRGSNIYIEEQKNALEEARSCIERLLTEYNHVQLDRDMTQQEAFASTEFYEEELQKKKEHIHELEMKLEQKEEHILSLQREWQDKTQAQVIAAAKEKAEVINQLHVAQDELSSLQHFRNHQIEIEGELEKVKLQLLQQHDKEHQHLVELERKYIEQSNHLKRDYEKSLGEIRNNLEGEIEERVGTKIMQTLQDNERLQEELRMHVEVTNGLQKDKSTLQLETAKLARDLDLLRQAEALHLQRSSSQARLIAENNNKLQKLEKSLGQVIRQYSAERRDLEEEHKKSIAGLQAERQTLKRLAQTKINELKKVRQLAQQVLRERGEVEGFLIESIHYVTDQIRNAKRLPRKSQCNTDQFRPRSPISSLEEERFPLSSIPYLPSVRSSSSWPGAGTPMRCKTSPMPPKRIIHEGPKGKFELPGERHLQILQNLEEVPVKMNPKVDISELTWEEREKVLRYLFQRINNAHQIPNAVPLQHDGYELLYGSVSEDGRAIV